MWALVASAGVLHPMATPPTETIATAICAVRLVKSMVFLLVPLAYRPD